jgi:hypothetical protein
MMRPGARIARPGANGPGEARHRPCSPPGHVDPPCVSVRRLPRLHLRGHPHLVTSPDASAAVRDSPLPVILVFASNWKEASAGDRQSVDSLAQSLSGEVTVLVADVVEDSGALQVWQSQGRPRAVLLSNGNEIGRGNNYPAEGPIRYVLTRRFPPPASEPASARA